MGNDFLGRKPQPGPGIRPDHLVEHEVLEPGLAVSGQARAALLRFARDHQPIDYVVRDRLRRQVGTAGVNVPGDLGFDGGEGRGIDPGMNQARASRLRGGARVPFGEVAHHLRPDRGAGCGAVAIDRERDVGDEPAGAGRTPSLRFAARDRVFRKAHEARRREHAQDHAVGDATGEFERLRPHRAQIDRDVWTRERHDELGAGRMEPEERAFCFGSLAGEHGADDPDRLAERYRGARCRLALALGRNLGDA